MATNVTSPCLRQQGISLITVLVMLLLATLIVLSSTRLGWLSEKLVGSESDRQRAFAAAEALIRDAERDIKGLQADNATPCQPGVGFVGCRNFASGAPFFPEDINDLALLEERLANTATGCLRGICLPASVGAMGRAAWIDNLAAMPCCPPLRCPATPSTFSAVTAHTPAPHCCKRPSGLNALPPRRAATRLQRPYRRA